MVKYVNYIMRKFVKTVILFVVEFLFDKVISWLDVYDDSFSRISRRLEWDE